MKLYDLIWLVPLFPLIGAGFNGFVTHRRGLGKNVAHTVALLGAGSAWVYGWAAMIQWYLTEDHTRAYVVRAFTWIAGGELTIADGSTASVEIAASFQVDPLSAVMVGFVSFVGFVIHLYSVGYMHSEPDRAYARYFSYLNLFMFAMLTLVLGSNLPVLFVGLEGVGLCSYLLIGFHFEEASSASAGTKAFIANRIGDLGFLLAIFFAFFFFGTLEFDALFAVTAADHGGHLSAAATAIGLLLFLGAIGKSAQIPLHVWLPDAVAGPTPASALIQAATMVTAGVYIVVRCNYFYQLSPTAMLTVAVVGGVTAVIAASIGLVQNDINKVLTYSTVSQLGFMFLAAGVGAYAVAIFHVVTHAFFKACLLLGSGSVIHACGGEQDMRKMGGLKKVMPTTYWTFLVATIAIAGIVPFAGFFSENEILARVFAAGSGDLNDHGGVYSLLWVLAVIGAGLTAFYMFRLLYMTFHGDFRGGEEAEHQLHESPWTMTLPLQILGVSSVIGGFIGLPGFLWGHPEHNLIARFLDPVVLHLGRGEHAAADPSLGLGLGLIVLLLAAAGLGIWTASRFYLVDQDLERANGLAARFPFAHKLLLDTYRIDELYDAAVIRGTVKLAGLVSKIDARVVDGAVNGARHVTVGSSWLSGIFDLRVVDGLVNLVATAHDVASREFRRLQFGYAQGSAMVMVFGAALLLVIFFVVNL